MVDSTLRVFKSMDSTISEYLVCILHVNGRIGNGAARCQVANGIKMLRSSARTVISIYQYSDINISARIATSTYQVPAS